MHTYATDDGTEISSGKFTWEGTHGTSCASDIAKLGEFPWGQFDYTSAWDGRVTSKFIKVKSTRTGVVHTFFLKETKFSEAGDDVLGWEFFAGVSPRFLTLTIFND